MSDSALKRAVIVMFLLFFATLTVGWVGTAQHPQIGEELMKLFQKEVATQVAGESNAEVFLKIFANNLEACILLFLGGASFGIATIFIMSLNGIVIGSIMEIVHDRHSWLFVAAAILPHGIFEIPAFILSGALGILVAQSLVHEWYGSGDTAAEAYFHARRFIRTVIPLVLIAAFVEAFITPHIILMVV